AIGIVIVVYGFGVAQPTVGVALAPAVIISAIICSAILEETVYRGSLFGYLDRIVGMWPAAVVSSAIFAVAHYNYSAYLGYFLLGLVWCRVYKKTGNIGVVIAAHMLFNLIALTITSVRG